MWLVLSLLNRSFLHAYVTGALFVVVNLLFGIEKYVFALAILIAVIIAEYREHKVQNHNYPSDWFSGIRDIGITVIILLFFIILSKLTTVLSLQQKIIALAGSIIFLHILIFSLKLFFKPSKKRHWEPKHFLDIVSNLAGPYLVSPVLFRLIF